MKNNDGKNNDEKKNIEKQVEGVLGAIAASVDAENVEAETRAKADDARAKRMAAQDNAVAAALKLYDSLPDDIRRKVRASIAQRGPG